MRQDRYEKTQWLYGYRRALREIERLEEQIRTIRSNKMSPSISQEGMPHAGGQSGLEAYAAKLDDMERRMIKWKQEALERAEKVYGTIRALPDTSGEENLKAVLYYRYIDFMKWEDIQEKLHADRATIYRWHIKALDLIDI